MNRKDHWENIYKEKSSLEVSWYQSKPSISLSIINSLSMGKDENVIDVGGGASTLVDYLLEKGFTSINILDLSSNALEQAKNRLGKKHKLVNWYDEDLLNHSTQKKYSLWHDRAAFHFLTESSDREKYKKVLGSSMKVGGCIIIAAFSIGGPTKCSGLDIVQYDADKIKKELGRNYKFIKEKSESHVTPGGSEQLFSYYVFTKST